MRSIFFGKNPGQIIKKVVIILVILAYPYAGLPLLGAWWFYKKSSFSQRSKKATTVAIGGIFLTFVLGSAFAYTRDVVPQLIVDEPELDSTTTSDHVVIKGRVEPEDKNVRINSQMVVTSEGKFEHRYDLEVGKNEIEVRVGAWKTKTIILIVNREESEKIDEEGAVELSATSTPEPTREFTPESTPTPTPTPTSTPTPIPTTTPTPTPINSSKPASFVSTPKSTPVPTTPKPATPKPTASPPPNTGFSCGIKKNCSQMINCEEAYYHLNTCGNGSLDRDNDGVPCESICN